MKQKSIDTTPGQVQGNDHATATPSLDQSRLLRLGNNTLNWATPERLLGVHVDNRMTWSDHAADVAKSSASNLSLLRRMQFLPRKQLEDVYTKVILPSVSYGLVVWGSCYKTHFSNLEILHTTAGRIVYGLSWDTSAADVLTQTRWNGLERMYKLATISGIHLQMHKRILRNRIQGPINVQNNSSRESSRNGEIILPSPGTNFMRNSIKCRRATAWNSLSS